MTDDSAVPLPCPNVLCQSKNILVWQSDMRKKHIAWSVMCRDCGASVGQRYDTEAEAIAAWNTRQPTQSDALKADNKRLRLVVDALLQHEASDFWGPDGEKNKRASYRGVLRKAKKARAALGGKQ